MLEGILNFPNRISERDTSEQDICTEISGDGNKYFPEFDELVLAIKQNEHLIKAWIEYAANKRSTPSWYFTKLRNDLQGWIYFMKMAAAMRAHISTLISRVQYLSN
jgi:hypothetical protein